MAQQCIDCIVLEVLLVQNKNWNRENGQIYSSGTPKYASSRVP